MQKVVSYFIDWGSWEMEFEWDIGGNLRCISGEENFKKEITPVEFGGFLEDIRNIHDDMRGEE